MRVRYFLCFSSAQLPFIPRIEIIMRRGYIDGFTQQLKELKPIQVVNSTSDRSNKSTNRENTILVGN